MTMPVTSEPAVRLTWPRQVTARIAVATARLLGLLPPRRLRQVLRLACAGTGPATAGQALAARQAVISVSPRCAGQGCLERSVATALLCRARGTWPDWCTGFRTEPFRAHAWVEAEGAAIGETGDMTLFHAVMTVRSRPREQT
jgi:hypothetical protein